MSKKTRKQKLSEEEPEYAVRPYDENEFFFEIEKAYIESKKKGQFHSPSYKQYLKKFKGQ